MPPLEESFEAACKDGTVAGVAVLACSKSGSFNYTKAFGSFSLEEGKNDRPMILDAVVALASATKILTSIAALQCLEKGLVGLDDDVGGILPELNAQSILTGFDNDGKPLLVKRQNPITLRALLTHTSGLAYDDHPLIEKYRLSRSEAPHSGRTIHERYGSPLVYEPGTSWCYSPGLDWAGLLVERLTDQTLDEYIEKNICGPLGVRDITFWPSKHAEMKDRMAGLAVRMPAEAGGGLMHMEMPPMITDTKDCIGGGGCYASILVFFAVVRSLLMDDEKLLKNWTVQAMFTPQLGDQSRDALNKEMRKPAFARHLPGHVKGDHGLGGVLSLDDDEESGRRKGTMLWSGMLNTLWFVDRKAGLCGVFGTQLMSSADADVRVSGLMKVWEKAMYDRLAANVDEEA